MNINAFEYYLALLQLQMAILGFVIAGIVALMQLLGAAKPRRQPNLLIRQQVLVGYVLFLTALLLGIAFACWVTAFPDSARSLLGDYIVRFFANGSVLLTFLAGSIVGLFVFAYLTYRSRKLLDANEYLRQYIKSVSPRQVRTYLRTIYGDDVDGLEKPSPSRKRDHRIKSFEETGEVYDPFQPIREYIKDNAFKSYDYGTAAGLRFFNQLFDKTLLAVSKNPKDDEYYYLAKYAAENALELFAIFQKTTSEKRKIDVIRRMLAQGRAIMEAGDAEGLVTIVRALEGIAKITDDDDEIIAAISAIHALTDEYLARHNQAKWATVAPAFEEICLSVTRISETYYLQKDNPLKTVPIIGYYTGEHRTVTAALVDFFVSYRDLADRYTDAYPMYYFEAIEAVIEALFARLADINGNGQQHIGLNRTYYDMVNSLFSLYNDFGLDAIEHRKPELLALCMGNLRRIIKPAKNLSLHDERTILTQMFVSLAVHGILELTDVKLKGERTISMYAVETLKKHATAQDLSRTLTHLTEEEHVKLDTASLRSLIADLKKIRT